MKFIAVFLVCSNFICDPVVDINSFEGYDACRNGSGNELNKQLIETIGNENGDLIIGDCFEYNESHTKKNMVKLLLININNYYIYFLKQKINQICKIFYIKEYKCHTTQVF